MAKRTRKKKSKAARKKPARRKKSSTVKKKKKRRAKPKSISDKVSGAYRAVVDTFKGTDRLRNKLEPPGTSETE